MTATTGLSLQQILDGQPAASVTETAQMLRVSKQAVYQMAQDGRLQSIRVGRRVVIPTSSIRALLDQK